MNIVHRVFLAFLMQQIRFVIDDTAREMDAISDEWRSITDRTEAGREQIRQLYKRREKLEAIHIQARTDLRRLQDRLLGIR